MSVTYKCDNCGKETEACTGKSIHPVLPKSWYERRDKDTGKLLHACSRKCRAALGGPVAPF